MASVHRAMTCSALMTGLLLFTGCSEGVNNSTSTSSPDAQPDIAGALESPLARAGSQESTTPPRANEGAGIGEDYAHSNRLIDATSSYLLQHAHNPVDWYPCGEEAIARARSEGKPIFLSVGYSTCYWCHVMEREVFENPEIAALMNQLFINIKVDREQRPDLDEIYMTATQMMTGRGGCPPG